jgi:hypothetical protein
MTQLAEARLLPSFHHFTLTTPSTLATLAVGQKPAAASVATTVGITVVLPARFAIASVIQLAVAFPADALGLAQGKILVQFLRGSRRFKLQTSIRHENDRIHFLFNGFSLKTQNKQSLGIYTRASKSNHAT